MKKFIIVVLSLFIAFSAEATSVLGNCPGLMSPAIQGDHTTGLCAAGAGLVDLYIAGIKIIEWSSSGAQNNMPVSITPDSSTIPAISIGGGTNVTNFMALSGGRAMIGYDAGYNKGGASGAVIFAGGATKGLEIFTGGSNGTLPSNGGVLDITPGGLVESNSIGSSGNTFTISGCSTSTLVGGAWSGKFSSGTTGTCTVTITINGAVGIAANHGWSCWANDETTPADLIHETGSTTTTATLSGTTVSGDVVDFGCVSF